jgi:hypothetical protein
MLIGTRCRICDTMLVGNGKSKLYHEIEKHYNSAHPEKWDEYLATRRKNEQLLLAAVTEMEQVANTIINTNSSGVLSLEI